MAITLSRYFPKDTEYFYSFPEGQESNFFSNDPPWKEELFATRPLVCAGENVKVIVFGDSSQQRAWDILYHDIGLPLSNKNNILNLPSEINTELKGKIRSRRLKKALQQIATPGKLVMAQPFLDPELREYYQIPPELSVWFNDKKNIPGYIPWQHLPKRYATFENGESFLHSTLELPPTCVVKVSSSASGDGVRICKSPKELAHAKKEFRRVIGTIIIEEYIDSVHNIGVHFGIPFEKDHPIEIVGFNEQLTTIQGEYLGALIDRNKRIAEIQKIYHVLLEKILPFVRQKGWYGVGGCDILIDRSGDFYFIDSNFRMTAMTAYLYQVRNGEIKSSIATFTGTFSGTEDEFKKTVVPLAKNGSADKRMQMITLTKKESTYHFNAGLFFNNRGEIPHNAQMILDLGIRSEALQRLVDFKSKYKKT